MAIGITKNPEEGHFGVGIPHPLAIRSENPPSGQLRLAPGGLIDTDCVIFQHGQDR